MIIKSNNLVTFIKKGIFDKCKGFKYQIGLDRPVGFVQCCKKLKDQNIQFILGNIHLKSGPNYTKYRTNFLNKLLIQLGIKNLITHIKRKRKRLREIIKLPI